MSNKDLNRDGTGLRQGMGRLLGAGTGRAGRLVRRGNAMIMAVSMTALLAIIGSSFVLVSRVDRLGVRNSDAGSTNDAALDSVMAKIQKVLIADIMNPTTGKLLDESGGTSGALSYDCPETNGTDARRDRWLASIEPITENASGDDYWYWPHISDLDGTLSLSAVKSLISATNGSTSPLNADADGDGINDSIRIKLDDISSTGKTVSYAVRIIDNSGMVNLGTAWQRAVQLPARNYNLTNLLDHNADSLGEFPHQVDLSRLLVRAGSVNAQSDAMNAMALPMGNQTIVGSSYDIQTIIFDEMMFRDYGWFGLFEPLASLHTPLALYGPADELELRNRFTINTTEITRLENNMWQAIGKHLVKTPTGATGNLDDEDGPNSGAYRTLPYSSLDYAATWYNQLTNNLTPGQLADTPRADQRHLLTTYSFSREVRPPVTVVNPTVPTLPEATKITIDQLLDDSSNGGTGKYRKVNINRVLELWHHPDYTNVLQSTRALAVLRLIKTFEAAGYTFDQGAQFAANLIDYVDPASGFNDAQYPTVFPAGTFGANQPTTDIIGNEQQPFITEIYCKTDNSGNADEAAVEIYNPPYNGLIELAGWELWLDGSATGAARKIPLLDTGSGVLTIAPGERIVYRTSAAVSVDTSVAIVNTVDNGALTFSNPLNRSTPVLLVHTGIPTRWSATTYGVVVDQVAATSMEQILPTTPDDLPHSTWRGLRNPAKFPPEAPGACTRNVFDHAAGVVQQLGILDKDLTGTVLDRGGLPLRVDNHVPLVDNTLPQITKPIDRQDIEPLPQLMWRVYGWYELGRVLSVGNPCFPTTGTPSAAATTITDSLANTNLIEELTTDINGNGSYEPADGDVLKDLNGNGIYEKYLLSDRPFLLDLSGTAPVPPATGCAGELMKRISFFSRTDDGIDNDNSDGDSNLTYTPTSGTVTKIDDLGMYSGADDLLECRVPGLINVNTAPEAVLKALFPPLMTYVCDSATGLPKMTGTPPRPVTPEILGDPSDMTNRLPNELEQISAWYAKAIVHMRTNGGPFTSLSNLLYRLDNFDNPDGGTGYGVLYDANLTTKLPQAHQLNTNFPHVLRFGNMVDAVRGLQLGKTPVGYWGNNGWVLASDLEQRDWIFSRMANLLTVRSDTFTAYILVRTTQTGSDTSVDHRYIAILDRSNVFLPETLGQNAEPFVDAAPANGFYDAASGDTFTDLNGNGMYDGDDSGEMARDPLGLTTYGAPTTANPYALNDFDHFDRQYTLPKVVALREVPDAR